MCKLSQVIIVRNFEALSVDLKVFEEGSVGVIYLDRAYTVNALNLEMLRIINIALSDWRDDDNIKAIFISGALDGVFCSGGDMKSAYYSGMANRRGDVDISVALVSFVEQYQLVKLINDYPKPIITFMNGITFGNSLGIAGSSEFRIVAENTSFALTQAAVGFFPDAGSMYFLSQCPGKSAEYMALTGNRLNASDLLHTGIATHFLPVRDRGDLISSLAKGLADCRPEGASEVIDGILKDRSLPYPEKGFIGEYEDEIDDCFSCPDVLDTITKLKGLSWAGRTVVRMRSNSPVSMRVIKRYLQEAKGLEYEQVVEKDFLLAQAFLKMPDFYEGIRALLIDEDNSPEWEPSEIRYVSDSLIDGYFTISGYSLAEIVE